MFFVVCFCIFLSEFCARIWRLTWRNRNRRKWEHSVCFAHRPCTSEATTPLMPQQMELLTFFFKYFCPRAGIAAILVLFPPHCFQVPKGVTMLRAAVTYHVHLSLRSSATNQGFTNNVFDFDANAYPEVGVVKEAYPACAVMPLSRMTVNETAVNNGDVLSLIHI